MYIKESQFELLSINIYREKYRFSEGLSRRLPLSSGRSPCSSSVLSVGLSVLG